MLLEKGANVNARSSLGNTALLAAAAYPGGSPVVELLLAHGAELTARNNRGASALTNAVSASDPETVKLLLVKGSEIDQLDSLFVDQGTSLLETAAGQGNAEIVDVLLTHLEESDARDRALSGDALNNALLAQKPAIARTLIERGADLTQPTTAGKVPSIVLAAYTETGDTSVARLMIDRDVDLAAKNEYDETVLTWARRRGHPELIDLLVKAGAPEAPDKMPEIPQREINLHAGNQQQLLREAVQVSLAQLQHSSDVFLKTRGSCVSCHHQNLPSVAIGWARDRGFETDRESIQKMIDRQVLRWRNCIDRAYQMDRPVPVPPRFLGYGLWGFSALGYPTDELTEAFVWYLAAIQQPDGHWVPGKLRPPMGDGDITATVLAMRSLQLYPLRGREDEINQRVSRAAKWLADAEPRFRQERVYKLLGLGWAGWSADKLGDQVDGLLATQRDNGGWAQLEHLACDAWATSQTLVALHVAGGVSTTHPAYQRGLQFLLSTQFEDGSWFVKSRTWPFQPPFDSGFPHDRDQWISAPATAWAVMAMVLAVEPTSTVIVPSKDDPRPATSQANNPVDKVANQEGPQGPVKINKLPVDFLRDIKPVLERSCAGCHHGDEPEGGLLVTNRDALLRGGDSEEVAIVPGSSDNSPLLAFVLGKVKDMEMPPLNKREKFPPLSVDELAKLRVWIERGAQWPEGVEVKPPAY